MREILFRGKQKAGRIKRWIEGYYYQKPNPSSEDGLPVFHGISDCPPFGSEVLPETVGQYTGIVDKNGTKIFEGDIVKDRKGNVGYIAFLMQDAGWAIVWEYYDSRMGHRTRNCSCTTDQTLEVVGNIYDNPEVIWG